MTLNQTPEWRQSDHDLLVRIDERTQKIVKTLAEDRTQFVSQAEFWPVKMIVYWGAGIVLLAVLGALLLLVVKGAQIYNPAL